MSPLISLKWDCLKWNCLKFELAAMGRQRARCRLGRPRSHLLCPPNARMLVPPGTLSLRVKVAVLGPCTDGVKLAAGLQLARGRGCFDFPPLFMIGRWRLRLLDYSGVRRRPGVVPSRVDLLLAVGGNKQGQQDHNFQ